MTTQTPGRDDAKGELPPCARCGETSAYEAWDAPLCVPCLAKWFQSPEVAETAKHTASLSTHELCATWRAATAEWLHRQRGAS